MDNIKKGLTAFQLKIIALIIMTLDHFAAYKILTESQEINTGMRMIGRIAAPLFLYLLVDGLRYTKNKTKYILRLYIAGAAVQLIRELTQISMGNIFQTFFYTALYITCIDKIVKKEKDIIIPVIFMIVPMIFVFLPSQIILNAVFPSPLNTEYSFLFVLLGVTWYFVNNKIINCVILAGLSLISGLVDYKFIINLPFFDLFTFHHLFISVQWYMILAIPFILLYNGKKGKSGLKYFFYVYYPAHQCLFFMISVYLLKR